VINMIPGLDGSWDEPCVAAEFLGIGESVYLSNLSEDNHRAILADTRDAGEQHCVVVGFTECLNVLCDLCLFLCQCLHNVHVTGEAVLFGFRECNAVEKSYSSWAKQVAVVIVLDAIAEKDRVDLVLVSGDVSPERHTMSKDGGLLHDGFRWDVRGGNKPSSQAVCDGFCIQCICFYLGFCDGFGTSHVHKGCVHIECIECFVDVIPGASSFDSCMDRVWFQTVDKFFDFCFRAFESLFFNDVSCLIKGSCLDKVFMDIHSYIGCTYDRGFTS
jgi:hypothetical protein